MLRWQLSARQTAVAALLIWGIFLVVIAILINLPRKQGKLYPTFVDAGRHFRNGEPLYQLDQKLIHDRDQYRYSPAATSLLVPWDYLPLSVGSVLWRWGQIIALLLAMKVWSRIAIPPVTWPAMFLLALPLCGGNVHNAQINPLVAALLLGSLLAFHGRYFWLAAFAIALGTAFKGYPLAMGLLLCLVDVRRFTLPLVVAHVAVLALPFAMQDQQYVLQQYRDWVQLLTMDDRSHFTLDAGYFNLQRLLLRYGWSISQSAYRVIELAAGLAAALFLCWGMWKQKWPRYHAIQVAGGLGVIWMTLFGPTTESSTYILLAALLSYACLVVLQRSRGERILVWTAYALMVSNVVINWFPSSIADNLRTLMPQAHGAVLLLIWIVMDAVRYGRGNVASSKPGTTVATSMGA